MTLGWKASDRAWAANGLVAPSDYLRLPATTGIACWHLSDLSSSYTDLINGIVLADNGPSPATLEMYAPLGPSSAVHFNGNTRLETDSTLLRRAGDITLELIMRIHEPQGETGDGSAVICGWQGGTGDANANTNVLYQLRTSSDANPYSLNWDSEHGTGTDDLYTTTDGVPLGPVFYLAATRISDVVRVYRNAKLIATSGTLTTPTGGDAASGRFCLGGNLGGLYLHATMFSVRVSDTGLALATLESTYSATLGRRWPISF